MMYYHRVTGQKQVRVSGHKCSVPSRAEGIIDDKRFLVKKAFVKGATGEATAGTEAVRIVRFCCAHARCWNRAVCYGIMAALTLMKNASRQSSRPARAAAWFLALLCLWMATVGLAHHTDLLRVGASSSAQTVLGDAGAVSPQGDLCAACQWTQTVQSGAVSVPLLAVSLDALPAPALTAVDILLPRLPRPSSPRAPPSRLPKHVSLSA